MRNKRIWKKIIIWKVVPISIATLAYIGAEHICGIKYADGVSRMASSIYELSLIVIGGLLGIFIACEPKSQKSENDDLIQSS